MNDASKREAILQNFTIQKRQNPIEIDDVPDK